MNLFSAPTRFLMMVGAGWTGWRMIALMPRGAADVAAVAGGGALVLAGLSSIPPTIEQVLPALVPVAASPGPAAPPVARGDGVTVQLDAGWMAPAGGMVSLALDDEVIGPGWPDRRGEAFALAAYGPGRPPVGQPDAWVGQANWQPPPSRWRGSAWLFLRDGDRPALASGGQLGGSQAGARLAYRLLGEDGAGLSVAGRLSTPLDSLRGAEAALGFDWQPFADVPVRLSVERRFALGPDGRNAWSAYAAGGFYRGIQGWEVDGYAQVGIVGAKRRDGFIDGALRVGRPVPVGGGVALLLGGGLWGAAQPGVSRLDIGPRAALRLPAAGTTVTAALEGRFRIAGDARPGSGAAFTLASDF